MLLCGNFAKPKALSIGTNDVVAIWAQKTPVPACIVVLCPRWALVQIWPWLPLKLGAQKQCQMGDLPLLSTPMFSSSRESNYLPSYACFLATA